MASCSKGQFNIVGHLEKGFYHFGYLVARRPWTVIFISLLITSICSLGFLNLKFETDANKIWGPDTSAYTTNNKWLSENFPQNKRVQTIIFQSDEEDRNILSPKSLKRMINLHKQIADLAPQNSTFESICHRIPISTFFGKKNCRSRRSTSSSRIKRDALKSVNSFIPSLDDGLDINFEEHRIKSKVYSDGNGDELATNLEKSKNNTLESSHRFEALLTTETPIDEEETNYDYESAYDYNIFYDDYDEEQEDDKDDCNDFSHIIGNQSEHHRNAEEEILSDLPSNVYCDLLSTLETKCLEQSILEIWMYHEDTIDRLTQEDILFAINELDRSPYFGFSFDYSNLLGSIKRNESGHIVSATSAMHHYVTVVDLNNLSNLGLADAGTEPAATLDEANYQWQWEVVDTVLKQHEITKSEGINIRVRMTRSFTDVSSAVVFVDMRRLVFCVIIMFIYTSLMLGHFDLVQQRIYLTMMGMVSVLFGIVIALGISFALGFPYMPHYAILPFIMIGLGIDDMFVIVGSWYNLNEDTRKTKSLEENIALTLKDAGVAITVTSVTDVCAFLIGCITLLPGLKAFCLTSAIGIAAVYLLQISWFVAWLVIDQKRIEKGRNGILPCIVHLKKDKESDNKDKDQNSLLWKNAGKRVFKWYGNLLSKTFYAILVILATLGLLSCGLYGTLNIRQEYDEVKMIPPDTYLKSWFENVKTEFIGLGQNVELFTGSISPSKDLLKLDLLLTELENMRQQNYIIKNVDSWWIKFKAFILQKWNIQDWNSTINIDDKFKNNNTQNFEYLLSDFLHSSEGGRYKSNIVFNSSLTCNKEAPTIMASSSDITYRAFEGPKEHIPSVNYVEELIKSKNFSSHAFTNGKIYGIWEIDKVIVLELWRNLGCALVCVFGITFLLLSDIYTSCQVLICVVFTLIDVVGALYFWNITIDVISCCCIIVTVGLCVDYSAHIAHAFLVTPSGSRLQRAQNALYKIGPAVMNGGTTTFLAVVLLCDSKSHAFITFFKVFFLTVIFGLYHALVFLPVMLSFETPFRAHVEKSNEDEKKQQNAKTPKKLMLEKGENNNSENSNASRTKF